MPTMPRFSGKGKKVAYKVMGVPMNLRKPQKAKEQKRINKRLVYEETDRAR